MEIKNSQVQKFAPWLAGFLAIVLLFVLVVPAYYNWQLSLREAKFKKALWGEREELENFISTIGEEKINRLGLLRPDGSNEPALLVQLQHIASKNKLSLELISFKLNDATEGELEISQNLSGAYDDFKTYLKDLERNSRLIDVTVITFSSPRKKGGDYFFSLKAKTYFNKVE